MLDVIKLERGESTSHEPGYVVVKIMRDLAPDRTFKIKSSAPLRKLMELYCRLNVR